MVRVSKEYGRWRTNLQYDQINYYQALLTDAVEAFTKGTGPIADVKKFQAILVKLYHKKRQGVIVRSRFQSIGIHEVPSFFHISQERKRGKKKLFLSLSIKRV
jgi:hypothetical protein